MKKTHTAAMLGALTCLACLTVSGAQGPRAHRQGLRQMPRSSMVRQFTDRRQRDREAAWTAARREGWEPREDKGPVRYELMAIRGNVPYIFKTRNLEAAVSIGADLVRGTLPYGVTGQTQTVGLWDEGDVLSTHQELSDRVLLLEKRSRRNSQTSSHSTHVAGTIGAAGVNPAALGMTPGVTIASYNYSHDLAEVTGRAMSDPNETDAIQVSNHSYGYICGWDYASTSVPRWYGENGDKQSTLFGQYDEESENWDLICHEAPYYLPFRAAGNDRVDKAPSEGSRYEYYQSGRGWLSKRYSIATDPGDDGVDGGYDSMPPDGTSKNVMTVGAVESASTGGVRDMNAAIMTSFSSWGPTNDGRVKPDVVTCGVDIFSCTAEGNARYDTYSGTSMAVASATGGAALLNDLYQTLFPGRVMRSATLKGLLIHTADDLGNTGPDYQFGWGLLNVRAAADLLLEQVAHPNACRVVEDVLYANDPKNAYTVFIEPDKGLRATLCWTEPPATAPEDPDSTTACLVNDLDLRIMDPQRVTYMPYVLDRTHPAQTAFKGDNTLDNVEQIYLSGPLTGGWYIVWVSHKGVLKDGEQAYSLLVSPTH